MDTRLLTIRKHPSVALSQDALGKRLGVTGAAISKIESGDRSLTEQMIKAICREFNVNYDWLKYGEGEIFENLPETLLDEMLKQFNMDDLDKKLILEYLRLPEAERMVLKNYVKNILAK